MISIVTVKLVPDHLMMEFYSGDQTHTALAHYASYTACPSFAVDAQGEAAAEEVYDLTNNPCRPADREQLYGKRRSVSVGDIVEVDGVDYLCQSFGWVQLTH